MTGIHQIVPLYIVHRLYVDDIDVILTEVTLVITGFKTARACVTYQLLAILNADQICSVDGVVAK